MQFLEHVSPGMVLLLVSESKISHVLAKHFDSVRVLSSARCATDFLDSTDDSQWHFDDVGRFSIYTAEMQLVVRHAEDSSGGPRVWTQISNFVRDALHSFPVEKRWPCISSGQILIEIIE